jgi:hypothetical protein
LHYDPRANISIISGYEMEGIKGLSKQARDCIKNYLAKPIGLSDLSALLAKMLKREAKAERQMGNQA